MEQRGNLTILKKLYKDYFTKLRKIVKPRKKIFVNFDRRNFFLATSLPYFKELKIFHRSYSPLIVKADNDNDRIYLYFRKKQILPDLIFFTLALLPRYRILGVPIFFSYELRKKLKEMGKKIFFIKTGHFYFKQAYRKYNLDFAFEPSGHFYCFKDLKTEAPYLVLAYFLQQVNFDNLPKLNLIRLDLRIKRNFDLENLIKKLKKNLFFKVKRFDGYLLSKDNNYFHLRKSKTELKLRISFEGDLKLFQEIKKKWLMKI
jgi:phosphomannomutase